MSRKYRVGKEEPVKVTLVLIVTTLLIMILSGHIKL